MKNIGLFLSLILFVVSPVWADMILPAGEDIKIGANTLTQNDKLDISKVDSVDSPGDEECLTWEAGSSQAEWQTCGGAGGGDDVKVDSVDVTDPDFVSTADIDFINTANTITADINEDVITKSMFSDEDWGDMSVSTNSVMLDNDVVGAAEMADADHGDVSWSAGIATVDAVSVINKVGDVDTVTDPPVTNEVLKWNGANWVSAAYDYSFVFSIASFSDGEATTQLIGSGTWEATGNISFTASYNNGPATAAVVHISSNGGVTWASDLTLSSPYTSGVSAENTAYPGAKDQYVRFQLDADKGAENDTQYESAVYFRNKIFWGPIAKASGLTEADVEGLSGSQITNDYTQNKSVNAGAGEYIVWAYPTSYTAMDEGNDYETDGGTDFKFNSISLAMTRDNANLSITNSAGYAEGYDVYISDVANLGNSTLYAQTTDQTIDPLYYGITTKTDTFLEADIEGLANNEITNDNTQVWDSVTTGAGEYMLFSFPKRLGTVTFWVGGFEGGFEAPEEVSVTNTNGWSEDYLAWRSTNSNLGSTVVETK